jgi:hypothetical protein
MPETKIECVTCHKEVQVKPVEYGGGLIARCPVCGKLAMNEALKLINH